MPAYQTTQIALGCGPQSAPSTGATKFDANQDVVEAVALAPQMGTNIAIGIEVIQGSLALSQANQYTAALHRPFYGTRPSRLLDSTLPSGFSFSMELKGGGNALPNTPTESDYSLSGGLSAIFEASGMTSAEPADSAPGAFYTPWTRTGGSSDTEETEPILYTFKLWVSDYSGAASTYVFGGCTTDLTFNFNAGEAATVDVVVNAAQVASNTSPGTSAAVWPTSIDYGTQSTLPSPVVKDASASRTSSGTDRVAGFVSCTIGLEWEQLQGTDSNSVNPSNISTGSFSVGAENTVGFRNYTSEKFNLDLSAEFYTINSKPTIDYGNTSIYRNPTITNYVKFTLGTPTLEGELTNCLSIMFDRFNESSYTRGVQGPYATQNITGYSSALPGMPSGFSITAI